MCGAIPLLRHMPYLSNMQSACGILYCRLWPLRLYSIFPHHAINGTILRKKTLLNTKCVLTFSTALVRNISHSKKIGRDMTKKLYRFSCMYSTCYSCQVLIRLEFSAHIFEKYSNMKFYENQSIRELSCSIWGDGRSGTQTDRET